MFQCKRGMEKKRVEGILGNGWGHHFKQKRGRCGHDSTAGTRHTAGLERELIV